MALHPALDAYSDARHIKQVGKALDAVAAELSAVSCSEYEVEVRSHSPQKGALRRFLEGIDIDEVDQTLTVTAEVRDCAAQIDVPMINKGWLLPCVIDVLLPAPISSSVACKRGALGRKWSSSPRDAELESSLDALLPKVRMNHVWLAMLVKIDVCYTLERAEDGQTLWSVQAGFKRGMFDRPKLEISKFLDVIPGLTQLLRDRAA